jgi:hypothetical protein
VSWLLFCERTDYRQKMLRLGGPIFAAHTKF